MTLRITVKGDSGMGGIGSTRWAGQKRKTRVEECVILGVDRVLGAETAPAPFAGTLMLARPSHGRSTVFFLRYDLHRLERDGSVLTIAYDDPGCGPERRKVTQSIWFQTTTPHFGGHRYYFSCPLKRKGSPCERRAEKLYLPPSDHQFGCRSCHDLSYKSRQKGLRKDRLLALMAGKEPTGGLNALLTTFSVLSQDPSIHRRYSAEAALEIFDRVFGPE